MVIDGKWWLIHEGEAFDIGRSLSVELSNSHLLTGDDDASRYELEDETLRF